MTGRDFPVPFIGFTFPSTGELMHWAGFPRKSRLNDLDVRELRQVWRAEMESRGYVLAWVDPATGKIASRE